MVLRVPVSVTLGCMAAAVVLASPAASQVAPPGAVIDLGTGTPSTVGVYTQYSATVTAATTGLYYTLFAFREDPAYFRFDDASVTQVSTLTQAAVSANLLTNPGFEGGTTPNTQNPSYVVPDGWGVVYQTGSVPAAAGTVDAGGRGGRGGTPHSGASVWDDGAVGSFDGIYQTLNVVAGQQYLISFYLSADNPFVSGSASGGGVEAAAYFGACGATDSCATVLGGFTVQQPSSATIATTGGDIAPNIYSLGSSAAMANPVTFQGGTLRLTGGSFPNNIVATSVVITASNGTVDTSTGSGGFSGVVSGPGSLTIIGSNTFSLTNANTYAGGTVLSGGTLLIGNDAALGTGTLTFAGGILSPQASGYTIANAALLSSNGTIDTGGFGLTYAGAIAGTGQLIKAGSGTLSLTNGNSYTGGTALNAGTIAIANSTALGTGPLTFGGGTLQAAADGLALGNAVTLAVNGTVDTQGFGLAMSGTVSGPGQLAKVGSGTLSLTNANSYTGGTALNAGTIAIANGSALGTGPLTFGGGTLQAAADGLALGNAVTLAVNGTVDTQGFGLAMSGTVSGPGQLTKVGSGNLALSGANTYAGGTLLSAGTIVANNATVQNGMTTASSIGTGTLTFDGGTLQNGSTASGGLTLANAVAVNATGGTIDANGNNVTLLAPLTNGQGVGTLTFANTGGGSSGVVTLGATSTFSGQAVIASQASVILSADNAIGTGNVEVEGLLDLGTSNQSIARLTGAGVIADNRSFGPGTGTVDTLTVQSGSFTGTFEDNNGLPIALVKASDGTAAGGTLVLAGTTLYTGPTTVTGGTLKAGSATALSPNSAVSVAGGATLDLNAFSSSVGSIAGAGTVTNTGATTATLTAGGTNASTTLSGLLTDGTAPLALAKTGTGTLSLTGANTYSGGTTVLAGTLGIGNNAALGSGSVALHDLTELQFQADGLTVSNPIALTATDPTIDTGSGTETLSGPITGPGALTKIGTGTLDLTGTDTYSGATEVAAGALLVDGSVVNSAITVDSGARLGGSGTIKSFTIGTGGTLSLATQTLTVTSNATFLAGSTYQTTVNADGTGSRLSIGGTAFLGGATLDVLAGNGTFHAATYTLLTAAGGVSGTFGTIATPASLALLRPDVTYSANAVQLILQPVDFRSIAATPNQAATAAAIQALGPGSALYDAVVTQDRAGAQQAFAAASGISHANARSIIETNTRLTTGLVIDRLWDVSGSGLSAQDVLRQFAPDQLPTLVRCYGPVVDPKTIAPPQTYTAWGEGFGSFGHTNAGANAGSLDRSLGGFVLGIDTPLGNTWRGGVAGGYTNTTYDSHLDGGQGTVQSVYGSLYGGARYGAIDIRVGTTVGGNFTDGRRTVAFPGFLETERSHNDGYSVQTFGEVGYRFNTAQVVVEPVAGAAFLHVSQDGFTENGGAAALIVSSVDNDLGVTTLGVRGEVAPLKGVPLVMHTFLGWQHVIGDVSPATTLAFAANAANTFSVIGTPTDRDALAAELALDYRATTALDIGVSYSGLVGEVASDHSVKGRVEYRF